MPELPEVETIIRVIGPQIQGLSITEVVISHPSVIAHPSPEDFRRRLVGRQMEGVVRRGKFICFPLAGGARMILHLRMTGGLLVTPSDFPPEKHTHVIFRLTNGMEMRFSDMRRFGRFWLVEPGEADQYSGIAKLGPEPFDENFTAAYLQKNLGKRRKAIKECLLDQSIVAGIGNIYSDEILFRAKINPSRLANCLTTAEWEHLAEVIPSCLLFYIEKNAIGPEEYLKTRGRDYRNTPFLKVYGHKGEKCPVCGSLLCKTVIGGRSSVYCPVCQK